MKLTFHIYVCQEKFRMTKHIFIFISDNFKYYGGTDYDSKKILHTYMNRIAIDEDDQHEILSCHEFADAPDNVNTQEKITNDMNIVDKARSLIFHS